VVPDAGRRNTDRTVASDPKVILNLARGNIICERAGIADRRLRRIRGLRGHRSLAADGGILLRPARSLHTAFVRSPIDVVFMDADLHVLELVEGLRPWRTASAEGAAAVLALGQGQISSRRIDIGDRLSVLSDPGSATATIEATAASSGDGERSAAPESRHELRVIEGGLGSDITVTASGTESTEPDAIRVLLVATDRRFRSVAAALLTRRGCTVAASERLSDVAALAKRECVDVVVLDAGGSLTVAARHAAQIERLETPIGVVVVDEHETDDLSTMPVIAKWGSFDALYEAIEVACPASNRTLTHVEH